MTHKYIVDIIVGTRPNFVKVAAIFHAYNKYKSLKFKFRLIHTGQHYDDKLSKNILKQLSIPIPEYNLDVQSGSHARQTSKIMVSYEEILLNNPPKLVIVIGDVNSALAAALAAKKLHLDVAHVESGLRSGDLSMPEEINRKVVDSIADMHFTTLVSANINLKNEGISSEKIFYVGNTMIDTLINNIDGAKKPNDKNIQDIINKNFAILTIHRPSNTNNESVFIDNLKSISNAARDTQLVYPVHPRVKNSLSLISSLPKNLHMISPQPYLEFLYLLKKCDFVITDSGGISEETTFLRKPCFTLRANTERPETIKYGSNVLVDNDYDLLGKHILEISNKKNRQLSELKYWDGCTGARIVDIINKRFMLL